MKERIHDLRPEVLKEIEIICKNPFFQGGDSQTDGIVLGMI